MNILVLSPHRDDAAFSMSIALNRWLNDGHRVTILNVFTRSLYAPHSDAATVHVNDQLAYISALRKREDEQFLKQIPGANILDLNMKDAPIRLRCDSAAVCDMDADANDTAIPKILKAIAPLRVGPRAFAALVLPLALGHHVDHRTVRDALLSLSASMPCAFYEDLPYATRAGVGSDFLRFREDLMTSLHEPLYPVLCHGTHPDPTAFKRRIVLLYASQIDAEHAEVIAGFSERYGGAERLWVNRAWLEAARDAKLCSSQDELEAEPFPG